MSSAVGRTGKVPGGVSTVADSTYLHIVGKAVWEKMMQGLGDTWLAGLHWGGKEKEMITAKTHLPTPSKQKQRPQENTNDTSTSVNEFNFDVCEA